MLVDHCHFLLKILVQYISLKHKNKNKKLTKLSSGPGGLTSQKNLVCTGFILFA